MPPLAIIGGLAAAGVGSGIASGLTNHTASSSVNLANPTDLENYLTGSGNSVQNEYGDLAGLVNAGPGQQDISNSLSATNDLASMLQKYQNGGYLPDQQQTNTANAFAASQFNPQRVALQQQMITAQQQGQQQAAALGRSSADPILMAKLQTNYGNQLAQLNSQQGAFGTNLAMQMPQMQLGYAQQRAGVLGGLASQAMQNRQALVGMGNQILGGQQQFQLGASGQTVQQQGGVGQAITGGLSGGMAGAGAGLSVASMARMGAGYTGGGGGGGFGGGGYGLMSGNTGNVFGGANPYMSGQPSLFGGGGGL